MSSYIMHICISDIVKRKLHLTDKFVFGAILPDLLKSMKQDRNGTHYVEEAVADSMTRKLPNIPKALEELEIEDKEIKCGYIAHLIEDYIWFNDFTPMYVEVEQDGRIKYLKDGTIHSIKEFNQDMYIDYSNSNNYAVEKCGANIENMLESLMNISDGKIDMSPLIQNSSYPKDANISNNKFMTKESIDRYIEIATEEVEKIVLKLMGE